MHRTTAPAVAAYLLASACGSLDRPPTDVETLLRYLPPNAFAAGAVDFETLRATPLGDELVAQMFEALEDEYAGTARIDPSRISRAVFGAQPPDQGVAILAGEFEWESAASTTTETLAGRRYHREAGDDDTVIGPLDRGLAATGNAAAVEALLERYDNGDETALPSRLATQRERIPADAPTWITAVPPDTALDGLDELADAVPPELRGLGDQLNLDISGAAMWMQSGEDLQVHASIETNTAEQATNLTVVLGLISGLGNATQEVPGDIRVDRPDETVVRGIWTVPWAEAIDAVRKERRTREPNQ